MQINVIHTFDRFKDNVIRGHALAARKADRRLGPVAICILRNFLSWAFDVFFDVCLLVSEVVNQQC